MTSNANAMIARVLGQFAGRAVVPTSGGREAVHIGAADLP